MTKRQAYRELEIPESASLEQVRRAYVDLAKRWHPDRHQSDGGAEAAGVVFQRITAAYRAICDSDFDADPKPRPASKTAPAPAPRSAPKQAKRRPAPPDTVPNASYPYMHPDWKKTDAWAEYKRTRSTFTRIVDAPGDFVDWLLDLD